MIELYSRVMTPDEVLMCETIITKTQSLRNTNTKISLCKTLKNLNLKSSFSDKDKKFWNILRTECEIAGYYDLIQYNKSVFCVSHGSVKVYNLESENNSKPILYFSATHTQKNWYCTKEEVDIFYFEKSFCHIVKAYEKSALLAKAYENGQIKQKQYYRKSKRSC